MSSLSSIVAMRGSIQYGDPDGEDVLVLQMALDQAGYRVGKDKIFGPRTKQVVEGFQSQHGLKSDGIVGHLTAAMLDAPHEILVATASPKVLRTTTNPAFGWPHDDTASLLAYYGDPSKGLEDWKQHNVVAVPCPWELYYEGQRWPHAVQFHRRAAVGLTTAFEKIWELAGKDNHSPILRHVKDFSGSGNFRPVRGSSRLSTHAFWAGIDFDAERLPLGHDVPISEMPTEIVDAFKSSGAFWGGDYTGRRDPMHFQYAHE